jgi:hypothetical protein
VRWFLVAFVYLGLACAASTQSALASETSSQPPAATVIPLGDSVVALNGPWKFSIGDSPADPVTHALLWAEPGFDDSKWETVDLTPKSEAQNPITGVSGYVPGWTARGHAGYWGYAWYRIRVRIESRPDLKLALAGPASVDDAYEVYDNGAFAGNFGEFSHGHFAFYYSRPMIFQLPQHAGAGSGESTQVIAFRMYMQPQTLFQASDPGGFESAPLLGEATAIANLHQVLSDELIRAYVWQPIEGAVFGLLGLLALSLALFDRSDRVYLWIGALLLMISIDAFSGALSVWSTLVSSQYDQISHEIILFSLQYAAWVMVWRVWFRQRRPAWVPWALIPLVLLLMLTSALGQNLFFVVVSNPVIAAAHAVSLIVRLILAVLMLGIVVEGIREQGLDGWLVLPAVLLASSAEFSRELVKLGVPINWFPFGVQIGLPVASQLLLVVVLGVLLVRRLRLSMHRHQLMALDVKQAQEVQQVILPQARTVLPGLVIESEYRPAREVGGDFFQIIPHATDGSLLIVAGDVAGKGLKAGMLVALLVGGIRSTAEWSQEPEVVLGALNQRLMGRGDAFATCQVLRISSTGGVTVANAGHLPPYLNGKPLEIEGSLPLGIVESPQFSTIRFQLEADDRLVLVSDGVLEATSANRELFGFERMHELLRTATSAATIAEAAQAFGQDDDISVISIVSLAGARDGSAGKAILTPA